jgi:hypothetical protein
LRPCDLKNIPSPILVDPIMAEVAWADAKIGDEHQISKFLARDGSPEPRKRDEVEWAV